MALAVLMFFSLVVFAKGETPCDKYYERLNDTSLNSSGVQQLAPPPQSPESVNTTFLLYSNNTDKYQVISAKNPSTIEQSNFNCSRKTVFIVHGHNQHGNDSWVVEMCREILKRENVNCIGVNWSNGTSGSYLHDINNYRVCGAEIACFINTAMERFNCSLSGIHLMAHSLGCHAAGEAGRLLPGIERIDCMDGAGPGFTGESNNNKLDASDANCVTSIHTNAALFGTTDSVCHMDYYLNGGSHQPGCNLSQLLDLRNLPNISSTARETIACDHATSINYTIAAIINPNGFVGYCASDYSSFLQGQGFPCPGNNCSVMGYYAKCGNTSSCRKYYLNTGPPPNYARYRYNVTVQTGGKGSIVGTISVIMYNSSNSSDKHDIKSGLVAAGKNFSVFVDGRFPPPFYQVTFAWENYLPFSSSSLYAVSVTVIFGNNGSQYMFCANETTKRENPQTLTPCPLPTPMSESTKS